MFVNKFKIRYDKVTSTTTVNIPISLNFTPTDNSELIEDKFVSIEKEKSINPITDYKKVRFKPAVVKNGIWEVADDFKFQLTMATLTIQQGLPVIAYSPTPSSYGNIGFTDADLFCRSNKLIRSFLTLSFFDSPNTQTNRLLYFNTIWTQIGDDQKEITGQVKLANEAPISYIIGDPILKPNEEHEGFHIYWYKDLVDNAPNKEYVMYMTATFNNANYGIANALYTLPTPDFDNIEIQDIDGVNGGLYLKVILKYDEVDKIYKYTFVKESNQVGVEWNTATTPTITFYQINGSLT